jgi:hypothetical protein
MCVEAFHFLRFSGIRSYWPVLACSVGAWLPRGASVHVADLLSLGMTGLNEMKISGDDRIEMKKAIPAKT